jgi:DNA-binding beta-propeller fold protein YncE
MGINAPSGLAFDAAGNLFVASNGDGTVLRIDAAHLTVSGTGADLTITAMTPSPVIGPLPAPAGLAFDGAGNLWVNYDGTIAQLTPTDIAGTGPKTLTPTIQIQSDVLSLPAGIAFDEGGGLWVANSVGQFGRFGPTQLTASGNIAPEVVITSPDVSYAGWFAIYPAPASTPLAHRLP